MPASASSSRAVADRIARPPCARMTGSTACIVINGPVRFSSRMARKSAGSVSSIDAVSPCPALLTSTSSRPNLSTVARTASATWPASVTSHPTARASPRSVASWRMRSCRRAASTTPAPARDAAWAGAAPMPEDAPVTSTTELLRSMRPSPRKSTFSLARRYVSSLFDTIRRVSSCAGPRGLAEWADPSDQGCDQLVGLRAVERDQAEQAPKEDSAVEQLGDGIHIDVIAHLAGGLRRSQPVFRVGNARSEDAGRQVGRQPLVTLTVGDHSHVVESEHRFGKHVEHPGQLLPKVGLQVARIRERHAGRDYLGPDINDDCGLRRPPPVDGLLAHARLCRDFLDRDGVIAGRGQQLRSRRMYRLPGSLTTTTLIRLTGHHGQIILHNETARLVFAWSRRAVRR